MGKRFRKLQAKSVLATLFFRHLFARVFTFWKRRDGLKLFFQNYGPDAILPVSANERAHLAEFGRCVNCSLCTYTCSAILDGSAPPSFEPKFLVLSLGRSSHESEFFLEEWLPCIQCDSCQVRCPTGVPIHKMGEVIIERRKNLGFRQG